MLKWNTTPQILQRHRQRSSKRNSSSVCRCSNRVLKQRMYCCRWRLSPKQRVRLSMRRARYKVSMALFARLEKRVRAGKFCARSAMGWDWRILSTTALKKYAPPRWITWVSLPSALFERLGLKDGDSVRIHQGACSATMFAERDARLPDNVVRIPAAAPASAQLGGLF